MCVCVWCRWGVQAESCSNGKLADESAREKEQCLRYSIRGAPSVSAVPGTRRCVCARPTTRHTQCRHFYSPFCCTLFNLNPIFREAPVHTRHMHEHKHPHNGFIRNKSDINNSRQLQRFMFTNTHSGADSSAPNAPIMCMLGYFLEPRVAKSVTDSSVLFTSSPCLEPLPLTLQRNVKCFARSSSKACPNLVNTSRCSLGLRAESSTRSLAVSVMFDQL